MGLFHRAKKELSEIEIELKKYPKKRRGKLMELYNKYQKGQILKIGEDIDNKEFILSKE